MLKETKHVLRFFETSKNSDNDRLHMDQALIKHNFKFEMYGGNLVSPKVTDSLASQITCSCANTK